MPAIDDLNDAMNRFSTALNGLLASDDVPIEDTAARLAGMADALETENALRALAAANAQPTASPDTP